MHEAAAGRGPYRYTRGKPVVRIHRDSHSLAKMLNPKTRCFAEFRPRAWEPARLRASEKCRSRNSATSAAGVASEADAKETVKPSRLRDASYLSK